MVINSRITSSSIQRERVAARTPMRCPICGGGLIDVRIRDLGGLTASVTWQVHAGRCEEHGWFQAEFSARPPREIFPVVRPWGAARRVVAGGREYFEFPTAWGRSERETAMVKNDPTGRSAISRIDPLDPDHWATRPVES